MSTFKTIFSGRLEFGSERNFDQVVQLYQHRFENYYRKELILKEEDEIFNNEERTLHVTRVITLATDKEWRNTLNLLDFLSEFAIAGSFHGWMTDSGKALDHYYVEPKGDKKATQAFLKGRELVAEQGMETEAKKALSRAIDKFERHAMAYERRGYVNFRLKNYDDAMYDFNKSIDINSNNPDAYLGRAKVHLVNKNPDAALEDLVLCCKHSIPHQTIFWQARRTKADIFLEKGELDKAALEMKLFVNRKFPKGNINHRFRRSVAFQYGKVLMELGEFNKAVEAFNIALEADTDISSPSRMDILCQRGVARQKSGETGYLNDWREAADEGSKQAAKLLDAVA